MKKQARDELEAMFEELGELEEVRALTRKKVLADALRKAMKAQKVTPAEMATALRARIAERLSTMPQVPAPEDPLNRRICKFAASVPSSLEVCALADGSGAPGTGST